jgi:NTP pyrophosphatase (non-canonical NTP hydrolase)
VTTLKQLQEELKPWQEYNFQARQAWEPLVGLQEEVGELSHAFLKKHQGIRTNEDHNAGMADAVGDVMVYLADFCNATGLEMQECLDVAWKQVKYRDWRPLSGDVHPYPDPVTEEKVD